MSRYCAMIIFDYYGVALIPARDHGKIIHPEFKSLAKLGVERFRQAIPEFATGTCALTFKHSIDVDNDHELIAIDEDGIEGLKLWIMRLCGSGLVCAGPHPPGYDVTSNYVQVGTTPIPALCQLGGFIHVWGSQGRTSERCSIPDLDTNVDNLGDYAANIHFRPRDMNILGSEPIPRWNNRHVEVQYEEVNEPVPTLLGGDQPMPVKSIKLFGFTYELFLREFEKRGITIKKDHILRVDLHLGENRHDSMEVKGPEGWEGLVAYIKNVILAFGHNGIAPLVIRRRFNKRWASRTGMLGRRLHPGEVVE